MTSMLTKDSRMKIRQQIASFRRFLPVAFLAFAILLLPAGSSLFDVAQSETVPVIGILSVVRDVSVTIRTANFPANTDFTATMGSMGTQGINGIVVGSVNSGSGGSLDTTFPIPAELKGSYQISIRLQSPGAFPYYSYNWFYNNTTGGTVPVSKPETAPVSGYSGIPTFKIITVKQNSDVTIETNNFPPNQTFKVTMGLMGTRGVNGIEVGTLNSGNGGKLTEMYNIPSKLHGQAQISIRAQTAGSNPYYAYNWFWNNDANVAVATASPQSTTSGSSSGTGGQPVATAPAGSVTMPVMYTGIPVMKITAVVRDQSVTFETMNYPPNQNFNVTMGLMGTQASNGINAGSFDSGKGGSMSVTMPIPSGLAGYNQISIRAQTAHAYPYFSYNWFYNNTTP